MNIPEDNALLPRSDENLAIAQSGFVERGLALADALLAQIDRAGAPAQLAAPPPIQFDWVTIPAGEFLMGSDRRKDKLAYADEVPQHWLYLPTYRIARVPVTVSQFAAFVDATGYKTTRENPDETWNWRHPHGPGSDVTQKQEHPVGFVSWHDAQAFCAWASIVTNQLVQLPSEAEWEKAAHGSDGRIYPWGDRSPTDRLCNSNRNVKDTTTVGSYPEGASPYGVLDMAGNVMEWTRSVWHTDIEGDTLEWTHGVRYRHISHSFYPYNPDDGRENIAEPDNVPRVVRGSDWSDDYLSARCAQRRFFEPGDGDFGLRVVCLGSGLTLEDTSPAQIEHTSLPVQLAPRLPIQFDWVTIPAGEFLMGSDKRKDPLAMDDEMPQHRLYLPAFQIARYPVTNAQYQIFITATHHKWPDHWEYGRMPANLEYHPVVNVSWHDARDFCDWASDVTDQTISLPSEAEWEKAARGTDGRIWPWGMNRRRRNTAISLVMCRDTTPVGSYPKGASPYGLLDMAGNVWELTLSLCERYPYRLDGSRGNAVGGRYIMLRGGSWNNLDDYVRCAVRNWYSPWSWSSDPGFRVVSPGK